MVISLNSFIAFNFTANHQSAPRVCIGVPILKAKPFSTRSRSLTPIHTRNGKPLLVANSDRVTTETSDKTSDITKTSETEEVKSAPEPSELKQGSSNGDIISSPKRLKLTAREKLKAARVRNRESEPKAAKKEELGSKVLEVLRETDRVTGKKRSGLPEAPTNMLDDSKRGMPKKGLTFELPVGWDVFLIITSVVVISTIMFTTTYIVWKVGAIHFNEY
ncbi:hypothetical protein L1987_35945 [Smallanthus sonchifolius]|uniref:Uncharacterized protein n=1 Tax=Smallanthus sonchifolius TaxID=185202 RepID=A0ACB9HBT6_9ASTR|nr:hypothetical protein L1987_35945 [Smallanthus sonchifolius]